VTAGLAVAQAALLASAISAAFLSGADAAALGGTLAGLAFVLAARAAVAWGQESVAQRCVASVKSSLRVRLLERAATLGPRWASEAKSGEVVALATRGLDALDPYFSRYLPQLALAAIVPLAVVISLAFADWVATITVALTVPIIPIFMALIGMATERRKRRRWDALTRLSHHFLDVVAGLPTLRVFGRAHVQLARLEAVTDDYRRESLATLRVAFLSAFALELAATLSVAMVAVGVGLRLVEGSLDLRTGLFVLILAPEAYLPLRQLGLHYHASEEGLAAAGAAFAIIEAPEIGGGRGEVALPAGGLEITAEDVSVGHTDRELAAPFQAGFRVGPGQVLALAGPSGVGKSTLLAAILGLLPVDSGRILVGGVPVGEVDAAAWHRRVGWVPQLPFLFPGSVADNVRLERLDAPDADVRAALTAVGLGSLDPAAPLGEAGSGISSGQRRRVGVARALLRGADVLLLDEPTAGLDAEAEATVLAAVRAAADAGATVILVAHRPAALAVADRIVTVVARPLAEVAAASPASPSSASVDPARPSAPSAEPAASTADAPSAEPAPPTETEVSS
jgi:ATP-binding cassette, subfamily C, bacterial CydCD